MNIFSFGIILVLDVPLPTLLWELSTGCSTCLIRGDHSSEKIALFWHQVFATGNSKVNGYTILMQQIAMFRSHGLRSYRDLLMELARNPAMIFWLDNNENHKRAVNENWGRELLELFSMGVGNYTEEDVREASRAFTGWAIGHRIARLPYDSGWYWPFEYKAEDHDNDEKIVEQPACARFIARHPYNFFVADEPQVPTWSIELPRDPEAINTLVASFIEANYEIRAVLRTLFNSDFFKEARFAKVKSPAEVVVGTYKLVGDHSFPRPGYGELSMQPTYMGQDLMNPPSVEGWHTGSEWINSGSLMSRVNFVAHLVGDTSLSGIQSIINQLKAQSSHSPESLIDGCLDLLGPLEVKPQTRQHLIGQAEEGGVLRWGTREDDGSSAQRVAQILQLIVATREYQFA